MSRPDISHSTGLLARFGSRPSKQHYEAALRVVAYLYSTRDRVIRCVLLITPRPTHTDTQHRTGRPTDHRAEGSATDRPEEPSRADSHQAASAHTRPPRPESELARPGSGSAPWLSTTRAPGDRAGAGVRRQQPHPRDRPRRRPHVATAYDTPT